MADDDKISKLPDALITHILSFLPTEEVVRTCILSKRWKFIWYSVPTLLFYNTNDDDLEKLYNYVNKYLKHRKTGMKFIADSGITSFVLRMTGECERSKTRLIDKWLAFAVEKKIKKIELSINLDLIPIDWNSAYYCIPKILLENAKYLTILDLSGIMLDSSYSFSFPSLKTLSLESVWHSDNSDSEGVVKFLLGCPSLEKLRLFDHQFLNDGKFRLQSLSLKFLELTCLDNPKLNVQVEAINLESLVLYGVALNKINISCKKLRNLSIEDCAEDKQSSLQVLISNNPLLENLTLRRCHIYNSKHLNISSQHLKSFEFEQHWYDEDEDEDKDEDEDEMIISDVTIESAPNLASFSYDGVTDFDISIESSNLLNGKFHIFEDQELDCDTRSTNMINFFSKINYSWNIISLQVHTDKALILSEKLKNMYDSPLFKWKHLKLVITECDPESLSELKNSLSWISPSLETLSINGDVIF
ncbi:hypothetical protein CsatB_003095 [Cannabis sativa]